MEVEPDLLDLLMLMSLAAVLTGKLSAILVYVAFFVISISLNGEAKHDFKEIVDCHQYVFM